MRPPGFVAQTSIYGPVRRVFCGTRIWPEIVQGSFRPYRRSSLKLQLAASVWLMPSRTIHVTFFDGALSTIKKHNPVDSPDRVWGPKKVMFISPDMYVWGKSNVYITRHVRLGYHFTQEKITPDIFLQIRFQTSGGRFQKIMKNHQGNRQGRKKNTRKLGFGVQVIQKAKFCCFFIQWKLPSNNGVTF